MANLIGSDANQISTNGMLGTAAFVDEATLVKSTGTQAPVSIAVNSTSPALTITQDGTGNALEVRDETGDSTPFVVDASGNIGQKISPAAFGTTLSAADTGAATSYTLLNYGANAQGFGLRTFKSRNASPYAHTVVNSGDLLGYFASYGSDGANYIPAASIEARVDGTPGTNDMPGRLVFSTTDDGASSPTERVRIDSAGLATFRNSTGLGYGTGSGGTVTQATSKSTAVTLNKPSGQITMHGEAVGAGVSVAFFVTNSSAGLADNIQLNLQTPSVSNAASYLVRATSSAGGFFVLIANQSGGSLSEALVLNFCVLKGSAS